MPCRLELGASELLIKIGCTREERATPQPIRVALSVESREAFPACETDRLEDTVDAAVLRHVIVTEISRAEAETLERLGEVVRAALLRAVPKAGLAWELRIHKPKADWSYVRSWTT